MRLFINIIRIITGVIFIFSGLVKAIDPLGLSYKMQEFFEAWASDGVSIKMMSILSDHALAFSMLMITLEVILGIALLIGWQKKITAWLLLLLMAFFTFLTAYVLYSGKVKACGCFGDCIPLTPIQTFIKDIILLVFSILILVKIECIKPIFTRIVRSLVVLLATVVTLFIQFYVLKHLPILDCLPFKKGNNIIELRKMPPNAIADVFDMAFIYKKDGIEKSFDVDNLPDSTWEFVDRKQILVKAGSNNIPLINDFNFTNAAGADVTDSILNNKTEQFLFFLKEIPDGNPTWVQDLRTLQQKHNAKPFYIVTSNIQNASKLFRSNNLNFTDIFITDGTAIKTAARANPTIYYMKGAVIINKKSWADISDLIN